MKKAVFLPALLLAANLGASVLSPCPTATSGIAYCAQISGPGSVTTSVSWVLEAQVVSVEVDDNLGNFLFGLTGPLMPTGAGSIFPIPQTISGLDLSVINLLTSTVGLTTVNAQGAISQGTPTFANVVLRTSSGDIADDTRFTAIVPVGSTQTPEPVTWGFIAVGLSVMVFAKTRRVGKSI